MAEYDNKAFKAMNDSTASKADFLTDNKDWSKILLDRGIDRKSFDDVYKKRWGSLDRDSYSQMKNYYNPEWYKRTELEFPNNPEILDASMKDASMYMKEMTSGMRLKEMRSKDPKILGGALGTLQAKKMPGLKGFFQRLLPGGETGYK
tara:strand:+ start:160 stop:603 length:444 start_codon:yes stop_codon:yes gene_type:complete